MTIIEIPYDRYAETSDRRHGRANGPLAEVTLVSNEQFLDNVLRQPKRLHYVSRDKIYAVDGRDYKYWGKAEVSLGIQSLHQAFQAHHNFGLRPDTAWYMIVHEVAEHVRQNSDRYASLFTDTPDAKQFIEVRDDSLRYDAPSDWGRTINLFRDPLTEKITANTATLFLPTFSTTTVEDETALLVALMDAASPYYEYGVSTMCHIPQVRLEGTAEDWQKVNDQASKLRGTFDGLEEYFADLAPVLSKIAATADGERDVEFWRSIYKYGGGSGGPYVSGWITAFFAHVSTEEGMMPKNFETSSWSALQKSRFFSGFRTNEFATHISQVPFVWDYFGTKYQMTFAAGITGVDFEDQFLTPRLGFAVAEV